MHELIPSEGRDNLRRGRLLAVQATILKHIDAKESAVAAVRAFQLANQDALVRRLVIDLENFFGNAYASQQQSQQQYRR
jgi:hypothetical protein